MVLPSISQTSGFGAHRGKILGLLQLNSGEQDMGYCHSKLKWTGLW